MSDVATKTKLLTRRKSVVFIRRKLGKRLSLSTFEKICAAGLGPPPAEKWGRMYLYDPAVLRQWTQERARIGG
jgi:hypothetical protein